MAERRYSVVLYGAVIVAAAATYGAYQMISSMQARSRIPMRPVVVAARDMPEGATFDRLGLTTRLWPAAAVPESVYTKVDSVVGRVTRVPVFAGEPIVPGRLAPVGAGPGLETKILPGTRAMAVRINDVAGISGLLQPNSRVDVLVTLPETNNDQNQIAKLFMENMKVLSVGTEVHRDKDGKPIQATTVTLDVTPEQAERLAVAMNRGTIQLVLRGYGDPDTVRTKGATARDVLAQLGVAAEPKPKLEPRHAVRHVTHVERPPAPPAPAPVVQAPPPPPRPVVPESTSVEVYHGDRATRHSFERPTTGGGGGAVGATGEGARSP